MERQEYGNFKRLIRERLNSRPDEYATSVEEMNDKELKGFARIFKVAIALIPEYKKATRRRTGDDKISDFEELESVLPDSGPAKKIMNEFHYSKRRNIIPVMFVWLCCGRSYERTVKQGEELVERKGTTRLYKWFASYMIRLIVEKSIGSGMRIREDWVASREQRKAIEKNNLVEWSIENEEDIEKTGAENVSSLRQGQLKSAGRKVDTHALPELLIENGGVTLKKVRIGSGTHTTEASIARMYIVLVGYRLARSRPMRTFRNALQQQYTDLSIVYKKGVQKTYRDFTSPFEGSKRLIRDIGKNRVAAEELRTYLSAWGSFSSFLDFTSLAR